MSDLDVVLVVLATGFIYGAIFFMPQILDVYERARLLHDLKQIRRRAASARQPLTRPFGSSKDLVEYVETNVRLAGENDLKHETGWRPEIKR